MITIPSFMWQICWKIKNFFHNVTTLIQFLFINVGYEILENLGECQRSSLFLRGCSYGGELARLGRLARLGEILPSLQNYRKVCC